MIKKKSVKIPIPKLTGSILILIILITLQSCYSVRIASQDGIAEKRKLPLTDEEIFYKDKPYTTMDTTITQKIVNNDFTMYDSGVCPNGFYSVEYKVNFGYTLLNMITFGKKKRVKVKYVCIKPSN